jgi:hypothetical protein
VHREIFENGMQNKSPGKTHCGEKRSCGGKKEPRGKGFGAGELAAAEERLGVGRKNESVFGVGRKNESVSFVRAEKSICWCYALQH